MHEILFYKTKRGEEPVIQFISELRNNGSKTSRINLVKIHEYIQALSVFGIEGLPVNYSKHLSGDIWELRPIRNRILFAAVHKGKYVLLHCFIKKTQKTPACEIEKARRELLDFIERGGS